jgi:hypothetical protein
MHAATPNVKTLFRHTKLWFSLIRPQFFVDESPCPRHAGGSDFRTSVAIEDSEAGSGWEVKTVGWASGLTQNLVPRDDAWLSAFPVIDETLTWDEAGEVGFGEGAEGIGGVARPVVEGFIAGEARGIGGFAMCPQGSQAALALRGAEDRVGEEAAGVLDADPDICRAAEGAGIGQPGLEGGGGEAFPGAFFRGGIVRQEVVAEGRTAEGG